MDKPDSYPVHGGQLRQLARQFGIPAARLLDFSANINPSGPPPAVLATLQEHLNDAASLTEYPDLQQTDLKRSIAQYNCIGVNNIVVSNGFVPLLEAVLRARRVRRCLLPVPAFVEYRSALSRAEIEVCGYLLSAAFSFQYDQAAMLDGPHDAILLANPQNPSGIVHDAGLILELIAKAEARNIHVLLDEAFIDYIPQFSVTQAVDRYSNLVVFRSVTKFHGIPGLRVAYAVSNPASSALINEQLPPWPITTLASLAVTAALNDRAYAARSINENNERRIMFQLGLQRLGLTVYPSAANFLLFRVPSEIDPDAFWRYMITKHQIVLRACVNYDGLPPGHFRAAIRTTEDNARLVAALDEAIHYLHLG